MELGQELQLHRSDGQVKRNFYILMESIDSITAAAAW